MDEEKIAEVTETRKADDHPWLEAETIDEAVRYSLDEIRMA